MTCPLVLQRWRVITFLHWAYDPAVVQRLLPSGLDVHTHDGVAWVGLAPFLLCEFRSPGLAAIPWMSTFPETNVRTYVVDRRSGQDGVWFLSLDAAALATVLGIRASLGLPYHWAAMTVEPGSRVTYQSRRWWPPAAGHTIVAEPGSPLSAGKLGERDHFLTGRWRAFTRIAGRLVNVPVEHHPWPLWSVRIHHLDEDLLVAAGLPAPAGQPIAHYSPGVDARFGVPRW